MKFGASIGVVLAAALATVASASEEQGAGTGGNGPLRPGNNNNDERHNKRNLQISAYYYGYNAASDFWSKGPYKCLADDVQQFESDIRRKPICEDQYPKNADFIHVCNDGINDYIEEREEKCFATSDECEDFGQTVADGIIATHCVLVGMTSGQKWPRSCKNTAIKECEAIVEDKKSYPKNCDAPGSSTRDKLAKLCEPEVEAYLSGPAPSPPSPVPSSWKQCDKISNRGDCRDCCKEAEDKKAQVCACQNYAGCPRDSCKE